MRISKLALLLSAIVVGTAAALAGHFGSGGKRSAAPASAPGQLPAIDQAFPPPGAGEAKTSPAARESVPDEKECVELAREIIETPDAAAYAQLTARYNATCPKHSFDCAKLAAGTAANKCKLARLKDSAGGDSPR